MKRFLIALTVALLLLCLTLGASAETAGADAGQPSGADTGMAGEVGDDAATAADPGATGETDAGTAPAADAGQDSAPGTGAGDTEKSGEVPENTAPPGEDGTDAAARETVGGRIAAFFETYIGEIFSALTLVGSLVLMCGYKRGFLPALCRGLDCVTRSTESLGRQAMETSEEAKTRLGAFLDRASPLLEQAEGILALANDLRTRAASLEGELALAADDRAREETLWRGVADLLYGVFSAANLPDYAKEQLGARYAALLAVAAPQEGTDAGAGV